MRFLILTLIMAATAYGDGPTTRPGVGGDVLVTPFRELADGAPAWTGRAIAENLSADLGRAGLRPAPSELTPLTPRQAVDATHAVGAGWVITGSIQRGDNQLRLTGQIIDATTGEVVGGLSATGNARDLFQLEDTISTQAVKAIRGLPNRARPVVAGAVAPPPPAQPAAPALPPPALQPVVPPQVVGSSYEGSALQAYVNANRTPSTDFSQQLADSENRINYGTYPNVGFSTYGYGNFGGFGYGGYGAGLTFITGGYYGGGYGGGGYGRGYGGRGFGGWAGRAGYGR